VGGSYTEFVRQMRAALESDFVSAHLHVSPAAFALAAATFAVSPAAFALAAATCAVSPAAFALTAATFSLAAAAKADASREKNGGGQRERGRTCRDT